MQYDPRTALVVVDVQNDFAAPTGSLFVAGGPAVVEAINAEIETARAGGAFVVYTQDWHPPSTPHFAKDGGIWIVPTGGDPNQPQQVDQLKLVNAAGSQIAKGVDGLFREVNGGALPADPLASATSGSLEGSNVNATEALVQMIEASRAWETQVKMIDTAKQIDDGGASLMRLD